nr:TPM domain-containing protein [Tissierella sp.]
MIKNKKQKQIFILSLVLIFIFSMSLNLNRSFAKPNFPEPSFEFYVYDEVGIISSEVENYIIGVNKEMYEKIGGQVVVAVVDSLQDLDINTYATSLFEKWKIGGQKDDNGLLMLIVPSEGQIWIETGYGLEGALPAGIEKRIIERDIIPSFKEDNYNQGITLGFNSIIEYIEEDYDIVLEKQSFGGNNNNYNPVQSGRELPIWPIIIFILIFGFIDIRFFRGMIIASILRSFFSGRGGGGYGGGGGGFGGGGSSGGGGRSGGGGAGGSW